MVDPHLQRKLFTLIMQFLKNHGFSDEQATIFLLVVFVIILIVTIVIFVTALKNTDDTVSEVKVNDENEKSQEPYKQP